MLGSPDGSLPLLEADQHSGSRLTLCNEWPWRSLLIYYLPEQRDLGRFKDMQVKLKPGFCFHSSKCDLDKSLDFDQPSLILVCKTRDNPNNTLADCEDRIPSVSRKASPCLALSLATSFQFIN
jgi:hypothetical protein